MARLRRAPGLINHFHSVLRRCTGFGALLLVAISSRAGPAPIRIVPGLEEPLVAMGPSSQPESAALEAALAQFNRPSRPPGDFADAARPLAAFLAGHPHSPWLSQLAAKVNLAHRL